jgi:predicted MPP superfamily phosphohydrolase
VVHPETIRIDNWPKELSGLRIAVISDIHTGGPFIDDRKLQQIVATTNALNPDLIVLLGDSELDIFTSSPSGVLSLTFLIVQARAGL